MRSERTPTKGKAFKLCVGVPEAAEGVSERHEKGTGDCPRATRRQTLADDDALFFLGKLNLNYVWLHLETLGRKTGWSEYWEARRSLDAALKDNPLHMRARVARAWVDYIVDTKMTRGTRWVLGGGSKKRAFIGAREAARRRLGLLRPRRSRIRALGNAGARSADARSDDDCATARARLPGESQAREFSQDRAAGL